MNQKIIINPDNSNIIIKLLIGGLENGGNLETNHPDCETTRNRVSFAEIMHTFSRAQVNRKTERPVAPKFDANELHGQTLIRRRSTAVACRLVVFNVI